ncbi:MAG: hypothetical protein IJQ83_05805 [Bacteroidales bacterium]|nr:hypothetical protein [Bacteroidales bacterium]
MKRLSMIMVCLLAMMSASLNAKAQEVTITLYPGWTWISYPNAETMDISSALGDFVPASGDIIQSQYSSSTYVNGYWRGGITHFMPGWGYMYYSNRTEAVSFVFGEAAPQLTVTTAEPTEITAISAVSGGSITSNDGSYVFVLEKGICWATHPNPMVMNDFFTENGSGPDDFTTEMTDLVPNTEYYVRAYAVTLDGTFYGGELNFTTLNNGNNDHDFVDLGLPSGTLWATCNVGANIPEEYGDYFAWGETQPKEYYDWSTYQYCNGSENTLTKYCSSSNYGYNGFTDDLTILLSEDDAATAAWGADWRMPSKEEWQELCNNTTCTWTTQNGVSGRLFTASNGNSIFLPVAGGNLWGSHFDDYGNYWSSSLYTDESDKAWYLSFTSYYCSVGYGHNRRYGYPVRAVRSVSQNNVPIGAIDGKFTINSNGDQVYFSQGNLQYQASTNTWRFAEHQWDYVGTQTPDNNGNVGGTVNGSDNANISSNYSGWIDLFGWGTSGYNHGAVCYQPWSTSQTQSDYYAYGQSSYNLFDQTGKADWGYNPISNGGNQLDLWRTLTRDEWNYIFNIRTTSSGIRYAKAQVNNVNGLVLLPDGWEANYYILNNTNQKDASFSSNIISITVWSMIEQHGAIFLPAAGDRWGTSVYETGSRGWYWSASSGDPYDYVYIAYFNDSDLSPQNNSCVIHWRQVGDSVRLVCNAQ